MKAAVVRSFGHPPVYSDFDDPVGRHDEVLLRVSASALTPLVKSQVSGKHYSSGTSLPFVPGTDGVGRTPAGERVYFAFPRAPFGAMAEQAVSKKNLCVGLPADLDDVIAAAIANPGMSSWAALTLRARLEAGESVLINGATGAAGRMAIRIAKHLGAKTVIATGRDDASIEDLPSLGADATIALDQAPDKLTAAFRAQIRDRGVSVILDYLWGPSVEMMLEAITGHGDDSAEPRIRFVQIGSIAGPSITFAASALRSSGIEMMGSGLGSVSHEGLLQAIGDMMKAAVPAKLTVDVEPVPLSQVEAAWTKATDKRVVFKI